jgi:hypothetical protein
MGFEYIISSEESINRFKRARMLYSVTQNTANISRVFTGQVISEAKLKGHSFGMNSKAKHWKFIFRVERKSESSFIRGVYVGLYIR